MELDYVLVGRIDHSSNLEDLEAMVRTRISVQDRMEEAEEVHKSLMTQETVEEMEDIEPQEQECKEILLKEFLQMKRKLEEQITQLRALADKADKIHKGCTISNVVAKSTSIVSGTLTIIGMGLAPVTAGVSLGLAAAGLSLGTASTLTGIFTHIVEKKRTAAIEDDANKLTSTEVNPEEVLKKTVFNCSPQIVSMLKIVSKDAMDFVKNTPAIELIKANPRLTASATRLMNSGRISAQSAITVGDTALAMSKQVLVVGIVIAGIFLLVDVYSLVKQSIDLQKGAQTASASRLRKQASQLESKLEIVKEMHALLLENPGEVLRVEA